jgi:hypothetical protein
MSEGDADDTDADTDRHGLNHGDSVPASQPGAYQAKSHPSDRSAAEQEERQPSPVSTSGH